MVRLLCTVLESRVSFEMVTLTPSEDSCTLDSRLHHVITGVLTPSATQINTAGLGDTTVVSMGEIVMVAGTGVGWKMVQSCDGDNDFDMQIYCNMIANSQVPSAHNNLMHVRDSRHLNVNSTYFVQPAQTLCCN